MSRANRLENPAPVAEFQDRGPFLEQLAAIERTILDMRTYILVEELPFLLENSDLEDLDLLLDFNGDGSLVFDNSELSEWEDDISDWDDFSEVFGSETLSQCLNAIIEVEDQEQEEIFRRRNLADKLFPLDSGDSDASDFSSFMMRMASREAAGLPTSELNTYNKEALEDSVNRFLENLEVELLESSTESSSSSSSELRQFLRHINDHVTDSEREENEETIEEQVERFFETLSADLENFDPEPIDENMEFMALLDNRPIEDWFLDLPAPSPEPSDASLSASLSTLSTVFSTRRAIMHPEFYPNAQEFFEVNESGDDFVSPFTQPGASRTSRTDSIEDISPRATPRLQKEVPFMLARNPGHAFSRQPALAHPAFYPEAGKVFKVDETGNEFINPFTQHPPSRNSPVREQAAPTPAGNSARVRNINPVVQPNNFIDSALPLEEQDIADCWLNSKGFGGSF